MSESLVHIQNNPTALTQGGLGLEGFVLKPAIMKLVQRTTTDEGAVAGKLFDTLAKTNFDTVKVVPLSIRAGRVLFPPGGELGSEPLCRSNDGVVPSPDAAVPQASKCASCDHGPKLWAKWKTTGIKPDCQEKFTILFVLRDTGMPYFINVGGASIKELKAIQAAIYRDVLSSKAKGDNRSIFDYSFDLVPASKQGKKGNYYVLSFQNLAKIENPGEFGLAFQNFVLTQKAQIAEETVDGAVDAEYLDEPAYQQP